MKMSWRSLFEKAQICRDWLVGTEVVELRDDGRRAIYPALYFLLLIAFYIAYMVLMQGKWLSGGEMFAEMGTNYFPNANSQSLTDVFFATDAGYIPMPQRLLAFMGRLFNIPAAIIPYFYTWSALIVTGAFVGAFCLRPFRVLLESDILRFLVCVPVLMIGDFGLRTFVNFTYLSGFFIAALTTLALVEKTREVPWWGWSVPILILSKPAVLSLIPMMVIVSCISKPRFRYITILSVVLGFSQVIRLAFSHVDGTFAVRGSYSLGEKLTAIYKYFLGYAAGFSVGPQNAEFENPLLLGMVVLVVFLAFLLKGQRRSAVLIFVGMGGLFFNIVLNCIALSDEWNYKGELLKTLPPLSHVLVGFSGCVLAVVGVIYSITKNRLWRSISLTKFGPVLFLLWLLGSGIFAEAGSLNHLPVFPILDASAWQQSATAIDSGAPVCVPVNPLGFIYQRNCWQINADRYMFQPFEFKNAPVDSKQFALKIPMFSQIQKTVFSLAVMVRPLTSSDGDISAIMRIKLNDGETRILIGSAAIAGTGGILKIDALSPIDAQQIHSANVEFNQPVSMAMFPSVDADYPGAIWMGGY